MKFVAVFNKLNDVLFMGCDFEFCLFISKHAIAIGLMEENALINNCDELDPNVIMQIFFPIISSHAGLTFDMKNPVISLTCGNGTIFVIKKFADFIYVAVNGDGEESESFIDRKLRTLHKILAFFYGPTIEGIKSSEKQETRNQWKQLFGLLLMWEQLYKNQQPFLMEASERLNVNSTLNGKCVDLLKSVCNELVNSGERNVEHALLLVDGKLLSLYSLPNALELQPVDLLIITLLVMYHMPLSGEATTTTTNNLLRFNTLYSKESTEVHSQEGCSSAGASDAEISRPRDRCSSSDFKDSTLVHRDPPQEHNIEDEGESTTSSHDNETKNFSDIASISTKISLRKKMIYLLQNVFLRSSLSPYTPYVLYMVQIFPGIVLVILRQASFASWSTIIYKTLTLIHEIREGAGVSRLLRKHGLSVFDVLNSRIEKLLSTSQRIKMSSHQLDAFTRYLSDLRRHWNSRRQNIAGYINDSAKSVISSRLEGFLSGLQDIIHSLFRILCLTPRAMPRVIYHTLAHCQWSVSQDLKDFHEYLLIKGQTNIVMTNFISDYPGLVHFIYVDRMSNLIMAPSLTPTPGSDESERKCLAFLHKKIWDHMGRIKELLEKGMTSMTAMDGNFLFSYYLWFEDSTGRSLDPEKPFNGDELLVPGIMTDNFYRELVARCFPSQVVGEVHCYELFTIHLSVVSSTLAVEQCKKLSTELWETSAEVFVPISLL